MRRKMCFRLFLLVFAYAFVFGADHLARGETTDASDIDAESLNNLFNDKIVVFKVSDAGILSSKGNGLYLHECKTVTLGGRLFILGKYYIPDHPKYANQRAHSDIVTAVAWAKVDLFSVYTEEQYLTYLNSWIERHENHGERQ